MARRYKSNPDKIDPRIDPEKRERDRLREELKRRAAGLPVRKEPQTPAEKYAKERERMRRLGLRRPQSEAAKRSKIKYHDKNRGIINAKHRERYKTKPKRKYVLSEEQKVARREKARAKYAANLEESRKRGNENTLRYRQRNPERVLLLASIHQSKRRALKAASTGSFTAAEIAALYEKQKHKCATCKVAISDSPGKKRFHIDHVMPLMKGGGNGIDNIQLLCRRCNLSKKDRHPDEWAKRNGLLFC